MNKIIIIAEAGVNHNGDLEAAKRMIDAAYVAGADVIKFQTFKSEALVTREAPKAPYQSVTTKAEQSQQAMLKELELSYDDFRVLKKECDHKHIQFLSTAFDDASLEFLYELGMPYIKVPSGEVTNVPYLRKVGALRQEVLLSTGMSTIEEIKAAIDILVRQGTEREAITVLHCTSAYPTPYDEVNLNAMVTMKKELGLRVGYSDHTIGVAVPIAAAALGATIIEKHFTLDKTLSGPDHKASVDAKELCAMIAGIREIEKATGDGIKRVVPSEQVNRPVVRKSIVAKCAITKGEILSEQNITVKRPGTGITAMRWDEVLGKKASRNFYCDEMIEL